MFTEKIKSKKEREVLQGTKCLIPLHDLSIDLNAFCLHHSRMISYIDEEPPLQAKPLLDMGNIVSSED